MAMRKAMMLKRLVDQANQWVSKNPDKTRNTLDKVETSVNQKTGGKYSHHLDKASNAVTNYFGIPDQGQPDQASGQPGPPETTGPQGASAPSQGSAPPEGADPRGPAKPEGTGPPEGAGAQEGARPDPSDDGRGATGRTEQRPPGEAR